MKRVLLTLCLLSFMSVQIGYAKGTPPRETRFRYRNNEVKKKEEILSEKHKQQPPQYQRRIG